MKFWKDFVLGMCKRSRYFDSSPRGPSPIFNLKSGGKPRKIRVGGRNSGVLYKGRAAPSVAAGGIDRVSEPGQWERDLQVCVISELLVLSPGWKSGRGGTTGEPTKDNHLEFTLRLLPMHCGWKGVEDAGRAPLSFGIPQLPRGVK